jgi:hypothetical protein
MKRIFVLTLVSLSMVGVLIIGDKPQMTINSVAASPIPANSPTKETAATPKILRSGTFVGGEHPTSGTVRMIEKNGQRILELDETFQTSDSGPDLVVVLHRSPDVIGSTTPPAYPINEGDYVILAPLQQYSGTQSYTIPENINSEEYQSAVIWCRQFNATFGAAKLQ